MPTEVQPGTAPGRPAWHLRARRLADAPPATLLLAAALLVTGGVLVHWLSDLTFWRDEWTFLIHRRGFSADVFLDPNYEHIAIVHVALYKALQAIFGMDSPAPFQIVAVATFLLSIALLFVYLRRRVGEWLALAAVLPLLLFGPSSDDLLWPFQVGFFGSMALGLGALLALERDDHRADLLACALLTASITFTSLGVPFALAAAVLIATGPERRRRAFVAAVPIVVYGLWWLGWGHTADSALSLHHLATAPSYVLDGFASSLGSLLGLAATRDDAQIVALDWGRPLLVGALGLAALRLVLLGHISRWFWGVAALATSFWLLAALNATLFREPSSSRYQYMGAIFILLIAAELLRGVRLDHRALIGVFIVFGAAALANASLLHTNWEGMRSLGIQQPAGLGALEIARDSVAPDFELTSDNSDVDYLGELDAASYLSAVDEFGSPAYTPEEIASADEDGRVAADKVLAAAERLSLEPDRSVAAKGCPRVGPVEAQGFAVIDVPAGGLTLVTKPGDHVAVRLRRYASESFPVDLGALQDRAARLTIPVDRSNQPWQLAVQSVRPVAICPAG